MYEAPKRVLSLFTAVALLGAGYMFIKSDNPYDSKNVTLIHRGRNYYSDDTKAFMESNFEHFESIMYDLSNGNYKNVDDADLKDLNKYIELVLKCDYFDYGKGPKSDVLINFGNYFNDFESRMIISKLTGFYHELINAQGSFYDRSRLSPIIRNATVYYHTNKIQIHNLPVFPRFIAFKLVRMLIDENENYYCYEIGLNYQQYKKGDVLSEIDDELALCIKYFKRQHDNFRK